MSNSTDQQIQQAQELSARQIFNRILKGEIVRIPNDPIAADQLKNHLNVIKSREKKLFLDLGLDFISSIVSVEKIKSPPVFIYDPQLIEPEIAGFEIKLIAPKKKRTFTTFAIAKNEPSQAA